MTTTIKKRHLRKEIRDAVDFIWMAATIAAGLYFYARMFLFIVGIDL